MVLPMTASSTAADMRVETAPVGVEFKLVGIDAPSDACRVLTALGLRRGCRFIVDRKTSGGGRVLRVNGSRVAVGRDMLSKFVTEVQAA